MNKSLILGLVVGLLIGVIIGSVAMYAFPMSSILTEQYTLRLTLDMILAILVVGLNFRPYISQQSTLRDVLSV